MVILHSRKRHKYLPIVLFFMLVILFTLAAVQTVRADGLHKRSEAWYEGSIYDRMPSKKDDTYPYNSETATINIVSLDVLYGTSRELVLYYGEVPYAQTYSGKSRTDQFKGYYAVDGTDVSKDVNPPTGAVSHEDYWGGLTSDQSSTLASLEAVNDNGSIVSLRIYALSHCSGEWGFRFGNWFYTVGQFFADIGNLIIRLLIAVKNLSMDAIMKLLQLESISEFLTQNFVGFEIAGNKFWVSPFTGFCVIMGLFALVGWAFKYFVSGQKKERFTSLLWYFIFGAVIIMVCINNKVTDLSSIGSNLVTQMTYTVSGSLIPEGTSNCWIIKVDDPENQNQIAQLQELSMINKTYIDIQIGTQFGVENPGKELSGVWLGDNSSNTNANELLYGVGDFHQFDSNLGYYFWFADSSAVSKTSLNKTYPETSDTAAEKKLTSMITYLQRLYNHAENDAQRDRIEKIVEAFARPSGWSGGFKLLAYTIVLILLALVLWKYCLLVLFSKLQMFFGLLGLSIAGPLIITNNDKLRKTGYNILGLIVISFIEIIVYCIVFDLIIFFIAAILRDTSLFAFILAIIVLILLMKFNPMIQAKLKEMLSRTERSIAPGLTQAKAAVKNFSREKYRNGMNRWDSSKKIVGYKTDPITGEEVPIYEERGGGIISAAMHHLDNELFNEGHQHKGYNKIRSENRQKHINNRNASRKAVREESEKRVKEVEAQIKETADKAEEIIENEKRALVSETYQVYKDQTGKDVVRFDESKLTSDEQKDLDEVERKRQAARSMELTPEYVKLSAKAAENTLTEEEEKRKDELDRTISQMHRATSQAEKQLIDSIDAHRLADVLREALDDPSLKGLSGNYSEAEVKLMATALKSLTDEEIEGFKSLSPDMRKRLMKQGFLFSAQTEHKDAYTKALQEQVYTAGKELDETTTRIGQNQKVISSVNRDAAVSEATAVYKLNAVAENQVVANKDQEIHQSVQSVVNGVAAVAGSPTVKIQKKLDQADKRIDDANLNLSGDARKEAIRGAKQDMKDARKELKDERREGKVIRKETRQENEVHQVSLSEQIRHGVEKAMHTVPEPTLEPGPGARAMATAAASATAATVAAPKPTTSKPTATPKPQAVPIPVKPTTGTTSSQPAPQPVKQQPQPQTQASNVGGKEIPIMTQQQGAKVVPVPTPTKSEPSTNRTQPVRTQPSQPQPSQTQPSPTPTTKAEPPRPIGEQLRNSQPKVETRPEPKAEPVVVERPQPTASPFVQPRPQPQVKPQVQPQTQAPARTSEPPVAPQRETSQSRREQPVPRQETKASFGERMRDFFGTQPTADTTTAPKTPKQTTPRTKGKPSEASMEDLRSRLAQSAEQNKPEPPKDDGKK